MVLSKQREIHSRFLPEPCAVGLSVAAAVAAATVARGDDARNTVSN